MKTMAEFYASDLVTDEILAARNEHARLSRIFEEEPTNGEEIPDLVAANTRLRDLLERLPTKVGIVTAYIGALESDVQMMLVMRRKFGPQS